MSRHHGPAALLALSVLFLVVATASADDAAWFRQRVALILEQRCVHCHRGLTARGHLSLETREAMLKGGDSGPAVDPASAEDSLLLDMISGDDPEMPKKGKPLAANEVSAIEQWINRGAVWPTDLKLHDKSADGTWWSLAALKRPEIPDLHSAWVRTPIDALVLAKLQSLDLHPAPEADRRTLIRRLYFDLLGLPPSPDEVDRFLADDRPLAYERLVDRLLASPHYGERWGRHWLDVVHFGQTHGYDKDKRRDHAWPYRDYVIRALNEDRPYGRFVLEQVAGDVLFPDRPQATVATGFIAAGPWDFVGHVELREGTIEKEKTRLLDRDDMLANTMSTFTSMTVHCARCHDHPFDPIPQDDYYALQAVFAGVDRGDRPYGDPQLRRRRDRLAQEIKSVRGRRDKLLAATKAVSSPELKQLDVEIAGRCAQLKNLDDPWTSTGKPLESPSNGFHSAIAERPQVTKWVQVDLGREMPIELIRLIPARPTDFADTPGFGFPLRFRVEIAHDHEADDWQSVIDETQADFPNPGDHDWTLLPDHASGRFVRVTAERLWKRTDDFVFALGELQVISENRNVALGAKVTASDTIDAGRWHTRFLVDGFGSRHRLADPADPELLNLARQRAALRRALGEQTARRKAMAASLVSDELRNDLAAANTRLASLERKKAALPSDPQVYAIISHAPRPIHVLRRGDVRQPLKEATPGALSCVKGLSADFSSINTGDERARRAALARWLVDPHNVLLWRSIVNRVWHYHFGRGIVDTPNDFGRHGSKPTHPELLDWLALELRQGQSLKSLHRMILTSAVYRQSSRNDPRAAKIDGENRFLWRMNRRRLDGESFRDAVLAVSGKLNREIGGPSFELFAFEDDHSPRYDYIAIDRPDVWRRTVYRFIVRSVPNPFLEALDCPDPSLSAPVRQTTITPLQALASMNDAFIVRQAEYFARRVAAMTDDPGQQIDQAVRLAFGRLPTQAERAMLLDYVRQYHLPAACRLLLNTNEFNFVD